MTEETRKGQTQTQIKALAVVSGVVDIFFGVFIVYLASGEIIEYFYPDFDNKDYIYILILLGFFLFFHLSTRSLKPRLGIVDSSTRGVKPIKLVIRILMFSLMGLMVIFFLGIFVGFSLEREIFHALFDYILHLVLIILGITLFVGLGYVAYSNFTPRYYLYAFLLSTKELIDPYLVRIFGSWSENLQYLATGLLMLLIGSIIFFRFTRKYPLPSQLSESQSADNPSKV